MAPGPVISIVDYWPHSQQAEPMMLRRTLLLSDSSGQKSLQFGQIQHLAARRNLIILAKLELTKIEELWLEIVDYSIASNFC